MLLAVLISSYGCTWEVWRAVKKLELHEAMQLLRIFRALQMNNLLILQKSTLERKENPFNKLTKDQNKRKLISYRQSCLQPSSGRHNQLWKKYIKNKNSKLNRCDVIENTQRVVKSKDSTLLNSQNVILYDFYKAKKYLPGTVESLFYEIIIVTYSFLWRYTSLTKKMQKMFTLYINCRKL